MLLVAVFEGITQASYQVIQSQEKLWLSFWAIALPRDSLIAVLAYYLIPFYGAVGLGLAYVVAWFFALGVVSILAYRIGLMPSGSVVILPDGC